MKIHAKPRAPLFSAGKELAAKIRIDRDWMERNGDAADVLELTRGEAVALTDYLRSGAIVEYLQGGTVTEYLGMQVQIRG